MDFDQHNRPDLSRGLAARMADALRDNEMLRLMDFYKCYRAYVRRERARESSGFSYRK
jgi:aminoglycoside phosphotransferase family enzyme